MSEDQSETEITKTSETSNGDSKSDMSMEDVKSSTSPRENDVQPNQRHGKKSLDRAHSWSCRDISPSNTINVQLDLAKSLNQLNVDETNGNTNKNMSNSQNSVNKLETMQTSRPDSWRHIAESPKSSPQLTEKWKPGTSKTVSNWTGKRNRKEIKKKSNITKAEESPRNESNTIPTEGNKVSILKTDNKQPTDSNEDNSLMEEEAPYKYKYFPNNSKSVVFTNDVLVVYFNNEDVVGETREPLKKEIDQQERNKEMRRIHLNKTQEKYNLCLY
ncbi:uncharacterized protein LOC143193927 [Rhynchophorus ferrugineus]|uniref:uncharacterized protein LOC143193927 n=1 Tax=Rhynchophorus ferrugineus TaxID=354439 RepID=UPI003FCC6750